MPEPFKNMYNREFLSNLASALQGVFPQFHNNTVIAS
jgi:hypothetical protein